MKELEVEEILETTVGKNHGIVDDFQDSKHYKTGKHQMTS